nr:protein PRRC2A-like [Macaca fascicularis]
MPLPGAGRGRGSGRGTAAALGGGGGCNVTHLRVRCMRPKRGPPQAGIFLVPPRVQGPRQRAGDCGSVPEAGREPAELGEEPPTPGAEHAAPACSTRVHRARRGGDRAEAVAPGRCLGPDRLHVSPARGHVHRLSPVRRPDVLRINKMKLGETGGQRAPGSQSPRPGCSTSPPYPSPAAAPTPDRSPRGKLQP